MPPSRMQAPKAGKDQREPDAAAQVPDGAPQHPVAIVVNDPHRRSLLQAVQAERDVQHTWPNLSPVCANSFAEWVSVSFQPSW